MRSATRIPIVLVLCMIVSISAPMFSETVSGEVIPDYDIDVDTTIVHLFYEEGNADSFLLFMTNQCAHTITVVVTLDGLPLLVGPNGGSVTIGPYQTNQMNIGVALPFNEFAGIYRLNIHTQITRVDGSATSDGRERHASVVVLAHRHHSVSVETGNVSAVKGEATSRSVLINNSGNAPDYFSLEFQNREKVKGYPAVDFIMVPPGENVEYPIIVSVSKKASTGPTSLDYRVHSIIDEGAQTNGTLLVRVVKDKTEENGLQSPIAGLSLAGGLMVFLGFLLYFQHSLNKRGLKKPSPLTHLFPFFLSILMLSSTLLIIAPPEVGAQVAPDFTISLNPASPLDPSPLTEDEAATGTMMVAIESHSIHEQVVRVDISASVAVTGYVMEHRIPAQGEVTFPLSIGIEKGTPYGQIQGIMHVETIEVNGVAVTNGYEADTGFGVISSPYSLPQIIPWDGSLIPEDESFNFPIGIEKGVPTRLDFTIIDGGNVLDSFNFTIENKAELEQNGISFSNISRSTGPIPVFHKINFEITPTKKLRQEFYVLKASAKGNLTDRPVGGCTVVLVREESDDDDEGFIPGFEVAMLLAVVVCAALVRRRR